MPSLHRLFLACIALFVSLGMVACGGGGNDPAEAVKVEARIAPFVGRWVACWSNGANGSEQDDLVVRSTGTDKAAVTRTLTQYTASTNCSGSGSLLQEEISDVTLLGKTVTVVDPAIGPVILEQFDQSGRLLVYTNTSGSPNPSTSPVSATVFAGVVSGSTSAIRFADRDPATLDAQGRPTALVTQIYIKQP